MPYTDPNSVQNPTAGSTILSAWGDQVRTDLQALYAPPSARARRGTNQTINNSTNTGIAADALDWDSHVIHTVVGGVSRFTVPSNWPGVWELKVNTNWQANGNGRRRTWIRLNGSLTIADVSDQMGWGGECAQGISTRWQAVATDYFEFFVSQDCGSALNLEPDDYGPQSMEAHWVRGPSSVAG